MLKTWAVQWTDVSAKLICSGGSWSKLDLHSIGSLPVFLGISSIFNQNNKFKYKPRWFHSKISSTGSWLSCVFSLDLQGNSDLTISAVRKIPEDAQEWCCAFTWYPRSNPGLTAGNNPQIMGGKAGWEPVNRVFGCAVSLCGLCSFTAAAELLQLRMEAVRDEHQEQAVGRRAAESSRAAGRDCLRQKKKEFNCKEDGRRVGGVAVREPEWSGLFLGASRAGNVFCHLPSSQPGSSMCSIFLFSYKKCKVQRCFFPFLLPSGLLSLPWALRSPQTLLLSSTSPTPSIPGNL